MQRCSQRRDYFIFYSFMLQFIKFFFLDHFRTAPTIKKVLILISQSRNIRAANFYYYIHMQFGRSFLNIAKIFNTQSIYPT